MARRIHPVHPLSSFHMGKLRLGQGMALLRARSRRDPGLLVGPLCALHGTWAFVSRASEPVLAPWHREASTRSAESTGVMGRRGQERPVTLDGAPGSRLITLAQTSRRTGGEPRNQRLVLAWLGRDRAAVASLSVSCDSPPTPEPQPPPPPPFSDGEGTSVSGRRCKCESLLEQAT